MQIERSFLRKEALIQEKTTVKQSPETNPNTSLQLSPNEDSSLASDEVIEFLFFFDVFVFLAGNFETVTVAFFFPPIC